MKKILCIGEALIDMICTDKGSSLQEGEHFLKKPGGAPTNVAAAIAALGGKVELAAKVGNDPFGRQLIDVMNDFGVSTEWILKDEKHFTTMAFVSLMEKGERDFVFSRGADAHLQVEDIKNIDLSGFSIIHFGSATAFLPSPLQSTYTTLLEQALQKNIFVSFDPNYRHLLFQNNTQTFIDQSWNFLKQCNLAKLSEEEAILITGCATTDDAMEMLLQETKSVIAVTLGEKGSLLGLNKRIERISSIPVQVVDTTGAGDAFTGSVLYQLSHASQEEINLFSADDWKQIFFNANKTAAEACTYFGAMEGLRHLKNVNKQ